MKTNVEKIYFDCVTSETFSALFKGKSKPVIPLFENSKTKRMQKVKLRVNVH